MNIVILGAAGFLGTNLIRQIILSNLFSSEPLSIKLFDLPTADFSIIKAFNPQQHNITFSYCKGVFNATQDFDTLTKDQDIVFHLISSTTPSTSNNHIAQEMSDNICVSALLFDSCVKNKVKKIIFPSSGGTVYGKINDLPIPENSSTSPISSYGVQKLTIEKLLYLYHYQFGLDYRIIRLANPYGPYQKIGGGLGAVTNFTYNALHGLPIVVYGDGSVVRDYIYIEDAIKGILDISTIEPQHKLYNLGSGKGVSLNDVITTIGRVLNTSVNVQYLSSRSADVPNNYLDISRYCNEFSPVDIIPLEEGIRRLIAFLTQY